MKVKAIGMFASVLCAIHCIATPVIAAALPTFLPIADHNHEWISWIGFIITYPILGYILLRDYKIHKNNKAILLMCVALLVQLACLSFGSHDLLLEIAHLPLLIISLLKNHKALHVAAERNTLSATNLEHCC